MNYIKIMLVDDNREFLETAAAFLSRHPEMAITGLANSALEALELLEGAAPELVLMDLSMPEMNGLEATRRIKALRPSVRVVMLTLYEGSELCSAAHEAGADDFVTKSEFGDSLVPLIFRLFPRLQNQPAHEIA